MEALEKLANAVARCKEQHDPRYHLFLTRCLSKYTTGNGYRMLAQLVRDEYFLTVLTANSDTRLEEELDRLGVRYKVLIVAQHSDELITEALDAEEENNIHIVKLPGPELSTGQAKLFSDLSHTVQSSLQMYFNRNIAIIGCMDQEEMGTAALAAHNDGGIYYVRENDPPLGDIIVECIEKQGKTLGDFLITGPSGKFSTFFYELDTRLRNRAIQRLPTASARRPSIKGPSNTTTPIIHSSPIDEDIGPRPTRVLDSLGSKRTTVFISYSHNDDIHLQRLVIHLNTLELDPSVKVRACDSDGSINANVWSDKKIRPGDNWSDKIMQAMEAAEVAILLVSADFLASDFIRNVELPILLDRYVQKKTVILPVIVSSCDYGHSRLAHIQSVNKISSPLSRSTYDTNEEVWTDVAIAVRENLAK
jgi:TIR domain